LTVCLWPSAAGRQDQTPEKANALNSLIEAERSFSRMSEEKGVREAFLTWLAASSVVFRPGPVAGRPTYQKADPLDPAILTWEPEVAEVSAAGDLGYTSGPYRYRPGRRIEPTAFGHYVSVWTKTRDGSWKVLLDVGVSYPRSPQAARGGKVETPASEKQAATLSPGQLRAEEEAFGKVASSFIRRASDKGLRKALAQFGTDDIRVYRPGRPPTVGKAHISQIVRDYAGRIVAGDGDNRAKVFAGVSDSGDLAFSYGDTVFYDTPLRQTKLVFFRIWRKEAAGDWKICLDVELPAANPS
jgi:ketosteroid isomerase-like protein